MCAPSIHWMMDDENANWHEDFPTSECLSEKNLSKTSENVCWNISSELNSTLHAVAHRIVLVGQKGWHARHALLLHGFGSKPSPRSSNVERLLPRSSGIGYVTTTAVWGIEEAKCCRQRSETSTTGSFHDSSVLMPSSIHFFWFALYFLLLYTFVITSVGVDILAPWWHMPPTTIRQKSSWDQHRSTPLPH